MYYEQLLVGRQPEHFASLRTHRDHSAVVFGERRLTWAELAELRLGRGARADVIPNPGEGFAMSGGRES